MIYIIADVSEFNYPNFKYSGCILVCQLRKNDSMSEWRKEKNISFKVDLSDQDIFDAMKEIPGYLDITPGDFKELFKVAYRHAMSRIMHSVKAKDIMTEAVIPVDKEDPVKKVADRMARNAISGVPVIGKDKKVVGVISEKDFLERMGAKNSKTFMGVVAECLKGKGCVAVSVRPQKAMDIMTSPAVTVNEDTTVNEIANIFTEKNINRVPVVNQDGLLTGIVSRADIVRASVITEQL